MLLGIETALVCQWHLHAYGFPSEAEAVSWLTKHPFPALPTSTKEAGKPNHSCSQPLARMAMWCSCSQWAKILHSGLGGGEGRESRRECACKALYSIKKREIVGVLPFLFVPASNMSMILGAVAAILWPWGNKSKDEKPVAKKWLYGIWSPRTLHQYSPTFRLLKKHLICLAHFQLIFLLLKAESIPKLIIFIAILWSIWHQGQYLSLLYFLQHLV